MPPAAIRMCEPSLGDRGNLQRIARLIGRLARDVVAAGVLEATATLPSTVLLS